MEIIGELVFACLGGWLSRICGGGSPQLSRVITIGGYKIRTGLNAIVYCLPYLLMFTGSAWGLLAFAGAVFGKKTGHGQYISLSYGIRQPVENDERLDFIVRFFFGKDLNGDNYSRAVFGMVVTGMAVTILPGILYGCLVNPMAGAVIVLSGALKAVAYMTGWGVYNFMMKHGLLKSMRMLILFQPTVWGEFLTGFFGWGAIAWIS